MQRLLKAAQARKLDRGAAVYAVAGWILVQAASIVLPTFDAPVWALRVFIAVVLIGFPVTLTIAWTVVPHPLHRKQEAQIVTTATDRALLALLSTVILLSVGQFAYEFWYRPSLSQTRIETSKPAGPADASVAVLPFLNMSGDPSKEYFSDGISEEILDELANQPNLRVAAQTSSFAFKGKSVNIQDIARLLHVHAVVEGSVREEGNRVRITAQLISADDGYHIWAQSYDGDLKDILVAQETFARQITGALTNRLLGETRRASGRPESINPDAYKKYLTAQYDLEAGTDEGLAKAVDLFQQVTVLEPKFSDGFAGLARAYLRRSYVANDFTQRREEPLAAAAASEALQLDPNNIEALYSDLSMARLRSDWESASRDIHRMAAINPNNATVLYGFFIYYADLGLPDRALDALQRASELDPLSVATKVNLSWALTVLGHVDQGAALAEEILVRHPDAPFELYNLCIATTILGDLATAERAEAQLAATTKPGWQAKDCAFNIAVKSRRVPEANALADELAAGFPDVMHSARIVGYDYFRVGQADRALDWLERAYDLGEYDPSYGYYDRQMIALRDTPRGKALWRLPLYTKRKAAHDRVAAELAARK